MSPFSKIVLKRKVKHGRLTRLVFLDWDPALKRAVVVKKLASKADARREARVMRAGGASPHLPRFYRYFERPESGVVVMERVQGVPLTTLLWRRRRFRPAEVVKIALGILSGLDVLHRAGYVHGDLHTANVLVDPHTLQTTLIDFQFSVRKKSSGSAFSIRKQARPPRFAPEGPRRIIDDTFDIYSVGYMCACMLWGRHLRAVPRRAKMTGEAAALWAIIAKAMRRDPAQRYRTARQMIASLRHLNREE